MPEGKGFRAEVRMILRKVVYKPTVITAAFYSFAGRHLVITREKRANELNSSYMDDNIYTITHSIGVEIPTRVGWKESVATPVAADKPEPSKKRNNVVR